LAIIGTGRMATKHARNFRSCPGVELRACCDVVKGKAESFAKRYRIPKVYTDWRALLREEELQAVSIVTPDQTHAPIAIGAARKGLHVFCEKPLATSVADARRMFEAARSAGVVHMVNFSYRDAAALERAADFIRSGGIGRVRHVEASYLQSWLVSRVWGDWRNTPSLTWRLSTAHGSLGVLGDLGCHIFDAASLLAGDFTELQVKLATYEKGIPGGRLGPYRLDANDSFVATVTFESGAIGTIHSTRWAVGHINSVRLRVYGDRGGLEIDLDRGLSRYRLCKGRQAIDRGSWRWVSCAPVPTCYQRFVRAIKTGRPDPCDFANGLKIQRYMEAAFKSARSGRPVRIRSAPGAR